MNYNVEIGKMSSIGDRADVHVAKIQGDYPTFIGNNVTISAGAMVHAATLSDNVMIGESAQVLDGSIVEMNAIIAPGAVVTPGTKVKMGELWSGSPAKKERMRTDQEIAGISSIALETVVLAQQHAVENAMDYKQLLEEEELADIELYMDDWQPKHKPEDLSMFWGKVIPDASSDRPCLTPNLRRHKRVVNSNSY